MPTHLLSSKLLQLVLFLLLQSTWFKVQGCAYAQQASTPVRTDYNVTILSNHFNITGLCIIKTDGEGMIGSLINEFGVNFMTFAYNKESQKVKLLSVTPRLDRWLIRRMLKKDLKQILRMMPDDEVAYTNKRLGLEYRFTKIDIDATEDEPIHN